MQPDLVRVRHMLDAAREVQQFTAGRRREDLDRGQRLVSEALIEAAPPVE
ncbi:MAG TPA: hypothetical protein VF615_22300 [Longimicrobiaceae bacterium]|jgi:hypothetical protein